MISSRKITEISDFPMPDDFPDFPSAEQVREYLQNYAKHFHLLEHIHFSTEVVRAHPVKDGAQWDITLSNGRKIRYKGVIVCVGHDWNPNIPTYPGNATLETMHSRSVSRYEYIFIGSFIHSCFCNGISIRILKF